MIQDDSKIEGKMKEEIHEIKMKTELLFAFILKMQYFAYFLNPTRDEFLVSLEFRLRSESTSDNSGWSAEQFINNWMI